MKKIILVNGWSDSGKDTFADYLVTKHNYKKLSFAYPLKNFVSKKYNIDRNLLDSQEGKKRFYKDSDKTLRDLLILEAKSKLEKDEAYFAKKLCERIKKEKGNIVVSDWRYPMEYNTVSLHFGQENIKTIQIQRFTSPKVLDPSEFKLKGFKFDCVVDNTGSLEKLYNFVDINMGYFF